MALTGIRWIAWCLVGCCVLATLLLIDTTPDPWAWMRYDALDRRRQELLDHRENAALHMSMAAERLAVLQMLDSVERARRAHDTVAIDPVLRADVKEIIRHAAARSSLNHAGLLAPDLAVLQDTSSKLGAARRRRFAGIMTVDYRIPTTAGARCLAVARVMTAAPWLKWSSVIAEISSDITASRLWGPCAYYSAFGLPGPRIKKWLDHRGWTLAQYDNWASPPPAFFPQGVSRWNSRAPMLVFASMDAVSCTAGDRSRCLAPFLDPTPTNRLRTRFWHTNMISTADDNPYLNSTRQWWYMPPMLGSMEWTVLGDMVRTIGPERFARFWQSEKDPVAAFHDATGQDLDAWVQDWLRRAYGPQEGGPSMPVSAGLTGVAAMLLAIAVALAIAQRRRVS